MKDIIDCWLPEIYITWVWSLKIQRIYSQLFFYNSNITDYWIYRQFLLKFSISKLHSLVNLIIIILLKPWYWNPLDLAWLKRFLYFGALKRQISARRFVNPRGFFFMGVYCSEINFTETGRAKGKANFHLRETGSLESFSKFNKKFSLNITHKWKEEN